MTKVPSSTGSSPPDSGDRWSGLSGLGSRLASVASVPPAVLGGSGLPPGVVQGESVIALTTDAAYLGLCCSPVGNSGQTYCFKSAVSCSIASHLANRESGNTRSFGAGIRVRANGTSNVFSEPVGDIALLQNHGEAILSHGNRDSTQWPSLFNDWSLFADSEQAAASRDAVLKAKLVQTPAKRPPVIDVTGELVGGMAGLNLGTVPNMSLDILDGLASYESVWVKSAKVHDHSLPSLFTVKSFLEDLWQGVASTKASSDLVALNLEEDRKWSDAELESSNRRITNLELSSGIARKNWSYGPTIWESLGAMATVVESKPGADEVNQSWNEVSNLKVEFDSMFTATASFQSEVRQGLDHVTNKVNALEVAGSGTGTSGNLSEEVEQLTDKLCFLVQRIEDLESSRVRDQATIEALQAKLEVGSQRLELRSGVVIRAARDLRAALVSDSAGGIDFGGFVDVYNIWLRAVNKSSGNPSMLDALKTMKDVRAVGLSEDEAFVVHSFAGALPGSISGVKTEKSSIPSLQNQSKWRNPGNTIGMACELENNLPLVKSDISIIIQENYRPFPDLASLAKDMQLHAIDFIQDFIRWVDDITKSLISSGNQPADVWVLVTTVMRAIFEEGIAPHRITPTKTTFDDDNSHRASVMIWGAVRTYLATESIQQKGFKDHPVVVGAYAKWLVNHSGKKDASEAKTAVQKLQAEVTELKGSTATKRSVTTLESRVETIKSVADKAKQQCADLKSKLSSA